jgi:hypothetical protein
MHGPPGAGLAGSHSRPVPRTRGGSPPGPKRTLGGALPGFGQRSPRAGRGPPVAPASGLDRPTHRFPDRRRRHVGPVPDPEPPVEVRDPDDDIVLASAIAAGAEILIAGDKDLLDIAGQVESLRIMTPRAFWEEVSWGQSEGGFTKGGATGPRTGDLRPDRGLGRSAGRGSAQRRWCFFPPAVPDSEGGL